MIVLDTCTFCLLVHPNANPPKDSEDKPIEYAKERYELLARQISKAKGKILIPTPVLAETLVIANEGMTGILNMLSKTSCFQIVPFDQKAAIELAIMTSEAIANDTYKVDGSTRQKVKIDRQIVAIAKANEATRIISDDEGVIKIAQSVSLNYKRTSDLPIPEQDSQLKLFE